MKAYLCGGINGLSDADAKGWREKAKGRLPQAIDPMRRDYRGVEHIDPESIIDSDLEDIDWCDAVLAMCLVPGWGTAMEIFYAFNIARKPVYIVAPESCSPWLMVHCTKRFDSLDEALDALTHPAPAAEGGGER